MIIVYCINTIRCLGGMELVTIAKANALSRMKGNEIWLLVIDDPGPFRSLLVPEVYLQNLDVAHYSGGKPFPANLPAIIKVRLRQRKQLAVALREIHPDVVISVGGFEKTLLLSIKRTWALVREVHFDTAEKIQGKHVRLSRFLVWWERCLASRYDRVVLLTEEEKARWRENDRLCVIPNPLRFQPLRKATLDERRILSVGRLSAEKNFDSLIRSFKMVAARHPGWILDILGDGPEYSKLSQIIHEEGLDHCVHLKGASTTIPQDMIKASIFVLSSRFESFGMVIVEAMACGLPVVSYDCPIGPRSIITDGYDGFLVHLGDEEALANRISRLIVDPLLRKTIGANAFETAEQYYLGPIMKRWVGLFNELVSQK